ncbi:ribonuclease P protein component [Sediminicola arcticus]|jgi:ribonuclease P protein component|uniref:Ribonuclease P protein component n=1 Tax=Sediminicola arcticus TaxID=1574308 RepID=A0ABV2SQP2_9FLAO
MSFTLHKKEKLKSKKLIEQLFAEGKSVSNYPVKLIYLKTVHDDGSKIKTGVTASKRNFKSAVNRNRIKRLMRECYRLNKPLIFNNIVGDYAFMFLYLGKDMPTYEHLEATFKLLFKKLIIKENHEKLN